MSTSEVLTTQLQLDQVVDSSSHTIFTPPGIFVEAAKYPTLWTGVLASTEPSEHLSIHDHPSAWRGLGLEAILMMRRQLYKFVLPMDARLKTPHDSAKVVQTIALSVSPVALRVEASSLPPRNLHVMGSQLPSSPMVRVKNIEILSEPEISRVAQNVTEEDIPAANGIWKLIDYDYSLDQVARLLATGLLGRKNNRRLMPTRSAYKATIDAFVNRAIIELAEKPERDTISLQMAQLLGDTFTVLMQPGEPRVDYLRIEQFQGTTNRGTNFEDTKYPDTNPRTSIYADHARYSAYRKLIANSTKAHITIFHLNRNPRSNALGPWITRAGVEDALESKAVELDDSINAIRVLQSLLKPNLGVWAEGTPLLSKLGFVQDQSSLLSSTR
ncbi:MAG: hypothetical protein RTU92_00960 [Candidatus Thorarchaeota archaeon]